MGSRIQKIAFIVFALLFVAIMAVMNTSVLNLGTNANKQLSTTLQTSDSASLGVYDDAVISGSTVQSAAKNPSSVSSTQLQIGVATKADPNGRVYTNDKKYSGSNSDTTSTLDPNTMINTGSQFRSHLVYNSNGVVVAIYFIQEGTTGEASITTLFNKFPGCTSPSHT